MLSIVYHESRDDTVGLVIHGAFLMRADAILFMQVKNQPWLKLKDVDSWASWMAIMKHLKEEDQDQTSASYLAGLNR